MFPSFKNFFRNFIGHSGLEYVPHKHGSQNDHYPKSEIDQQQMVPDLTGRTRTRHQAPNYFRIAQPGRHDRRRRRIPTRLPQIVFVSHDVCPSCLFDDSQQQLAVTLSYITQRAALRFASPLPISRTTCLHPTHGKKIDELYRFEAALIPQTSISEPRPHLFLKSHRSEDLRADPHSGAE
ncbi:MAG TPA: hypothetical protein VFS63_14295 [Pseudolabrys sp.]|nr:hypothetical protein [Pseudolabrys sp.]